MLGLHTLPYDLPGRGQGHGLLSSSSVIEQSPTDHNFTGGGCFKTFQNPSPFIDVLDGSSDEMITSSTYYRQPSDRVTMSSNFAPISRQFQPPPLYRPLIEPFGGYGSSGNIPQRATAYRLRQHDQVNSRQMRDLRHNSQLSIQTTLPPNSTSFIAQRNSGQLQNPNFGSDAVLPLVTSSLSTSHDDNVASNSRLSIPTSSITAAGSAAVDSVSLATTSSFDLYYRGRVDGESLPPYSSPLDMSYGVPVGLKTSCSSAAGRISAFTAAVASTGTNLITANEPFQKASVSSVFPEIGGVSLARSFSSTTSSSSGCGLAIDDATISSSRRPHQMNKSRGRRAAVAVPPDRKDSAYFERRKKNNESARRSRESRHSKEQSTLADCQQVRERNTKIKIQIELLQREYNEMCHSAYGRLGSAAASRLIVAPPYSSSYGYPPLTHAVAPSIVSESYMPHLVPPGVSLSGRANAVGTERILAASNQCV